MGAYTPISSFFYPSCLRKYWTIKEFHETSSVAFYLLETSLYIGAVPLRTYQILILLALLLAVPASCPAAKEKPKTPEQPPETLAWPPPPAPAKIKWTAEYRSEFDVGAKKRKSFVDRLAGKSEDALWIKRPISVAVDEKGVVYVGDMGQGVVAMDPQGHRMWRFSDVSKTTLATPVGIAADSKLVYVTDANTNAVALFDKSGRFLSGLGPKDGIKRPVGIAVDEGRNLLVVVNGGEHDVLLLDRQLKLIKKIGKRGTDPGQFNFPTYCCIVPGMGFAVTDTGNFRIQLFDFDGKFIRAFGKAGDVSGCFGRPKGIAVDPDGNLYVVDSIFSNYQVFRTDGQLLTFVGQGGAARGQFQVPCGIGISPSGMICVADEVNGRIQVFQYISKGGEEGSKPAPAR